MIGKMTNMLTLPVMVLFLINGAGQAALAQDDATLDTEITSAINTELWIDNAVTANEIDVSTHEGIVTLKGTVDNIMAKDRAQEIAEATVGVRAVVNRISVEPAQPRSNRKLKKAVVDALLMDPVVESYEVTVSADDGVVTLNGTVDSYAESSLAETVAKGVKGVVSIDNNITVDYKTERPDQKIKNEIKARLENDIRVDDYMIEVNVSDGKVALSGLVGSLREKNRAILDCWVAGVTEVAADDLGIKWWARDEMRRIREYVSRTDNQIQQAVKDALVYDPRVDSVKVYIAVDSGSVKLSGNVADLRAKLAAEKDAENTLGVWRVRNNIKVREDVPENDVLEQRVGVKLINDPYVERYQITVDAYSGWVYLSGEVNTSYEKSRAGQITERVKGVVGVVNNIEFGYQWAWKPDREIREDVKDQLQWSPYVYSEDIVVAVDDGVVILSGTVNSWSEKGEAAKNAFQGGAKDVINDLVVDYQYYGPYGPEYYGSPMFRSRD